MDTRIIRRLIYDENYKRAMELMIELIEKQDKEIDYLHQLIDELKPDY